MTGKAISLLVGMVLVMGGCSGRLHFDPRVDGGPVVPSHPPMMNPLPAPDAGPPAPPPDAQPPAPPPDAAPPPPDAMAAGDTTPPPDTAPAAPACPAGTDVLTDIFKKSCGACHGAAAPAKNLDLVSTGLAARLVNRPSSCNGRPLVDGMPSADAPSGLLFDKLSGAVTDCGVQMPAGAAALSPSDMACVKAWALQAVNSSGGR